MIQKPVHSCPATLVYHTAKSTPTAAKKCRNDTENIQTKASRRDAQPAPARSCSKGLGDASPTSKMVISAGSWNDHFSHVVLHIHCLPGLRGGKRLAGRKTKFLHGVYHHALLARIVTAHFDCCQIRQFLSNGHNCGLVKSLVFCYHALK